MSPLLSSLLLPVTESSQVGEARRTATALARDLGFDDHQTGKIGVLATEAANNLVKYAHDGAMLFRPVREFRLNGLELLALDRGPGIPDVAQCMADGYSTAGSPGNGLGAMARLASEFDIHSVVGRGTTLLVRLWAETGAAARPPRSGNLAATAGVTRSSGSSGSAPFPAGRSGAAASGVGVEVGAVSVPHVRETVCGDAWSLQDSRDKVRLLVVDGLGHGPAAAQAAQTAVRIAKENPDLPLVNLIHAAHAALRSTRGAALGVAELNLAERLVRYAGIGNISGVLLQPGKSRSLFSHNGIVGHELRQVQEFQYPWPAGGVLVMHSDGVNTRWTLDPYPGLMARHPALIAGTLYRDANRGRDDVTVVALTEVSP